ncbi:B-cell lymphoma 6 protein homolog isoform X2 [Hyalella azteca]|uniref:B-cell lymphoma 6 protein homolog isoform X2 n=1 Tax=Hyalella azteca TaxID=294128 RepID=A0A8B7NQ14_HYAAZ|nr:B-cell lymphoma 6 protein homolog isoform X2 [Hyalella azteca]
MKMSTLLSLKWNHHHSTFVSVFSALKSKDLLCDVSVVCGTRIFPAHKLVLAASSPFFQQILAQQSQCTQPLNMMIVLQDVDSGDFEALLDYMYKGEASVAQNALSGLIRTAEQLQIRGLATGDSVAQLVRDNDIMLASCFNSLHYSRHPDGVSAGQKSRVHPISKKVASINSSISQKDSSYDSVTNDKVPIPISSNERVNCIDNRQMYGTEDSEVKEDTLHCPDNEEIDTEPFEETCQDSDGRLPLPATTASDGQCDGSLASKQIKDKESNNYNKAKKRSLSDSSGLSKPELFKHRRHRTFEEVNFPRDNESFNPDYSAAPSRGCGDAVMTEVDYTAVKTEPLHIERDEESAKASEAYTSQDDDAARGEAFDDQKDFAATQGLRPKEEDQGSWELSTTVPAVDTPTIDTGEDRGLTALLSLAFSNKYIGATESSEADPSTANSSNPASRLSKQTRNTNLNSTNDLGDTTSNKSHEFLHFISSSDTSCNNPSRIIDLTAADTEDGYAVGDSWSHSLFKPQNQDDDLNSLQSDLAPEGGMGPETSDGVYQCQVCSYRSHKRWDFMNHVRIHTGEKPFTCPYCPHRSALKNNMRRHIMLKHKLPFLQ